jgi:antibiotic biosynthesis monooxygenase (ABM) superfamily enzyme
MEANEIHVAVVRRVRPGREAEFESAVSQFLSEAETVAGSGHARLIRPVGASGPRDYGFIRTFANAADRDAFYGSDFYRQWDERMRPLVEGEVRRREIHGLEAFFHDAGVPPPKWKMALLTWIGVTPTVYIFIAAVPAVFGEMPPLIQLCIVTAFVVPTLAWAVMPLLVRLFRSWLHGNR